MATVNKLVNEPVVTENHGSHSLEECKAVDISDVVDVLNQARYNHATTATQSTAFCILYIQSHH